MSTLHYIEQGNGTSLVWLHPFPFSGAIYQEQLAIENVRHVIPDLAGFGKSSGAKGDTVEQQAHAVIELLDELQISSAVFAGVSMGGYVALAIARLYPSRVIALVLADTKETADSAEARTNRFKLIEKVEAQGAAALVEGMFPKMLAPDAYQRRVELAELVRNSMLEASSEGSIDALRAMAARPDSSETLKTVGKPVLIIVGESDAITPPSEAERMAQLASGSRLETIKGAGHLAMLEQPQAFNAAVSKFVSSLQ